MVVLVVNCWCCLCLARSVVLIAKGASVGVLVMLLLGVGEIAWVLVLGLLLACNVTRWNWLFYIDWFGLLWLIAFCFGLTCMACYTVRGWLFLEFAGGCD